MREAFVDADGFRIRFLEEGQGEPLVIFHGGGGIRVSPAHSLLAERRRVILLEAPGFGSSPANERTRTLQDLAATMAVAIQALGIERFDLLGNSFGAKLALWLAIQQAERVGALVLAAPSAIRPEGPPQTQEQIRDALFAHPERRPPGPPPDPETQRKHAALLGRLMGPPRDADLEAGMRGLQTPVLAVFGTADRVIPPELARTYAALLPNCHIVFVYDAAHAVDGDRPEAFAAVVSDFLERKDKFLVTTRSAAIYP